MSDLFKAIKDICAENKIDESTIIEALKDALIAAYKKKYCKGKSKSEEANVTVDIDTETGHMGVYAVKTVVEEVEKPREEISLDEAKNLNPNAEIGDVVNIEVTPMDFGRMSAMTAKQVITQRIKEAKNGVIRNEYGEGTDRMVTGTIVLSDDDRIYVQIHAEDEMNLENVEAVLPKKEQAEGEVYIPGDVMRFYVSGVKTVNKSTQFILSRTHKGLVRKLFEKEVPEIKEGIVEIKEIARESGSRTKIAVYSNDPDVDAQGACIGTNGMRVMAVNNELKTEKIDIIKWSPDPAEFISAALSPAQVESCIIDESEKSAKVTVPAHQISLAIGKLGQNARLAAKLTGWKIDISAAE